MQDGSLMEVTIRERQLDSFGHVNHAEIFRILEDARWERLTKNGCGLEDVIADGKGPVILEANAKFRRELRLREVVQIETKVEAGRGKFFKIHQTIRNSAGEVAVIATYLFCLFDTTKRKMVALDEKWSRALLGVNVLDTL